MLTLSAVVLAALLNAPVQNVEACQAASGSFMVTSGAPFTITWVMDPDPNVPMQPVRTDGFNYQIDGGLKVEITGVLPGAPCLAGTPQAGKIPYSYRTASGVARGSHTLALRSWNYTLDAQGNPTTLKQESAAVTVPFDAVDALNPAAPSTPANVSIKK